MDAVRFTARPDGTFSDGASLEEAMNKKPEAPAASPFKTGGIVTRVTVSSETGETTLSTSSAKGANVATGPKLTDATALDNQGNRISLNDAAPDTVIDLGGNLGSSNAATWERLGYIVKDRQNGGYRVVAQEQSAPSVPADKKAGDPAPTTKPEDVAFQAKPEDAIGIPGTSADVDSFQTTLVTKTPMAFEGALTSIVKGVDVDWAQLAEAHKADPKEFQAQGEKLHGEYIAAGQKALSNVGVVNHEGFEAWAREQGDRATDAVRDLVSNKSTAALQKLGREYVAMSNNKLATLLESKGVDTKIIGGVLHVSRASLGLSPTSGTGDFKTSTMTLAQAIREGYINA